MSVLVDLGKLLDWSSELGVLAAGALVGLLWHIATAHRRRGTRIGHLLSAFLGAVIACAVVTALLSSLIVELRYVAVLRTLTSDSVNRITVFSKYGDEELFASQDEAVVRNFLNACRDMKPGFLIDFRESQRCWYLVLDGRPRMELECHYHGRWPDRVVGFFVLHRGSSRETGVSISYYGEFSCRGLRRWFEDCVEPIDIAHHNGTLASRD
jgi:hypothetical protein